MKPTVELPQFYTDDAFATTSQWKCPEFKVSGAFSSHMVLQREKPIRVWGFSRSVGSTITAHFMGETVSAQVGSDNRFMLTFRAKPCTAESQTMIVYDDLGHEVTFEDVLVGDVWLVSGQSNAELPLSKCVHLTPNVVFDENDRFRLFYQDKAIAVDSLQHIADPSPDVICADWSWKLPDERTSLAFPALGWYFAKEITKHVDVPLGLVAIAAGGAALRELMPVELNYSLGYRNGANVREGGYFDTLINPFIPLAFKAMIFFQGESEGCWRSVAEAFDTDLCVFFTFLRERFGQEFPLYAIQLSDYPRKCERFFPYTDIVRTKQFDALSVVPHMTLIVAMDLGADEDYPDWAHSPKKAELADRVARLALAKEYGVGALSDVASPHPIRTILSEDNSKIVVEFADVGEGLAVLGHAPETAEGLAVHGFSVGSYEARREASAYISGRSQVTVIVPENADTSYVNYAFAVRIYPDKNANLVSGNALPCPAFSVRTQRRSGSQKKS